MSRRMGFSKAAAAGGPFADDERNTSEAATPGERPPAYKIKCFNEKPQPDQSTSSPLMRAPRPPAFTGNCFGRDGLPRGRSRAGIRRGPAAPTRAPPRVVSACDHPRRSRLTVGHVAQPIEAHLHRDFPHLARRGRNSQATTAFDKGSVDADPQRLGMSFDPARDFLHAGGPGHPHALRQAAEGQHDQHVG